MEIKSKEEGKYLMLTVSGRVDTSNYEEFAKELQVFIEGGKKFLALDLENLEYISSSGLRVFLSTLKALRAVEGDVILCCMNDKIKSVFEISGFLSLFRVEDSLSSLN